MSFLRVPICLLAFATAAAAQQPRPPATQPSQGTCTVQQAMQAEQRQDWTGAIRIYTCLSNADPRDWRPVNSIAGVYGVMNRPSDEIQWSKKASSLAPQQPEPYLNMGSAQAAMKDDAAARASFEKAMQVAPNSPLGPYSLGVLADEAQNTAEAEKWYRRALEINPKFEDASVSLAALLGNTNRVDQAIPILQKVVAANPRAQDAKQMLADMQRGGPQQQPQAAPQQAPIERRQP